MITFNYETDFELDNQSEIDSWISNVISREDKKVGEINYIFCDDDYLQCIRDIFLQVKKQYAVPVYNMNNIHEIPDENILFKM